MVYKLISYPAGPNPYKALIAAKYAGVEIEVPAFNMGVDNKTAEFLKKNPNGKVPVLETPEGTIIESNSIARFIARQGKVLYGKNEVEAAQIDGWMDWALSALTPVIGQWVYPYFGFLPFNAETEKEAKTKTAELLAILDGFLADKTFIVGERISLADIVISMTLLFGYTLAFEPAFRAPYTNVNRYFNTLVRQPNFAAVIGDVKLATKAPELPKKEEPKKAEAEEEPKEKEKPKNPLDLLPPSKMVFDEFKRQYSNQDTRSVVIPWFFENFDPEGYSCYWADYKYNDELGPLFKTCNLISGMFQRLERLHKYGFGICLIVGTNESHAIKCFWMVRGNGLPKEMLDCDDTELYDFRRIETPFDDATKERIGDFFAWDKPIDGQEILEGKVFK